MAPDAIHPFSDGRTIETIRSGKPGPRVAIMVGVHGNEPCGIRAVEELWETLSLTAGEAVFILANPAAVTKGVRATEQNLNRMFQVETSFSEAMRNSYEYQRSRELMPILESVEALLDIHSSATPDSPVFVICEPHSFSIANTLPATRIVSGWDMVQPGGTDAYMNSFGKYGICIECGFNDNPQSTNIAKEAILAFLGTCGLIEQLQTENQSEKEYLELRELYRTQTNFTPTRSFADFEFVRAGESIGIDGDVTICAPYDAHVIFVRARAQQDEEAFLLAVNKKAALQ